MYVNEYIKQRGNFDDGEPAEESIFTSAPSMRKTRTLAPKDESIEIKLMRAYPATLASKYSTRNAKDS